MEALEERYPDLLVPGPWFRFRSASTPNSWRCCQPDALVVDLQQQFVTIVEVKLRHTAQSWWQLRRLYEPVVRKFFGSGYGYSCCEIVGWFDPNVLFPENFTFTPAVHRPDADGKLFVHILGK